jgi:hypothetical protein
MRDQLRHNSGDDRLYGRAGPLPRATVNNKLVGSFGPSPKNRQMVECIVHKYIDCTSQYAVQLGRHLTQRGPPVDNQHPLEEHGWLFPEV